MFSPKKICAICLIIVMVYNLLIVIYEGRALFPQNSVFQTNVDIGESYFYAPQQEENIFIGSSISQYIDFKRIDSSLCLSMAGTSPIECLKIINGKESKPKNVFVEINVLYSPGFDIASNVFFLESLKKQLPAFRQAEKPLNKIMWLGLSAFNKLEIYKSSSIQNNVVDESVSELNSLKQDYINSYVYAQIDSLQINKNMMVFESELSKLNDSGVNIYLMEIPVHEDIVTSNRHSYLLNRVAEIAEKMQLDILFFRAGSYFWTDGIHMDRQSAIKFQENLANRIPNLTFKGGI